MLLAHFLSCYHYCKEGKADGVLVGSPAQKLQTDVPGLAKTEGAQRIPLATSYSTS